MRQLGLATIGVASCLVATAAGGAEQSRLPSGFVYLRDIDASIVQDIRYAGRANFTNARVPGYFAGECILLRQVAEALKLVQADLRQRSLSLKVYDCYRPVRAVRAFMDWVRSPEPGEAPQHWPRTQRSELVKLGYIASSSVHSTGAAVDLTLVKLPVAASRADSNATYAPCNAGASREPDNSLDMGTSFDCFDPMSHTASNEITSEQRENRRLLIASMAARGFKNYDREWWHFTYVELPSLPKVENFLVAK